MKPILPLPHYWTIFLLLLLAGCTAPAGEPPSAPPAPTPTAACPVSQPTLATPPQDDAVMGTPAPGYYFLNADRSIWAAAWEPGGEYYPWQAGEEGVKVGWFRPAGVSLDITGRRLDADPPQQGTLPPTAAPLLAEVPCCYPTRFQASGLYFPTGGCWEVTARAGDSSLAFVIWVEP